MPRNIGGLVGQEGDMPKKQVRRRRRASNTAQTKNAASSRTPGTGDVGGLGNMTTAAFNPILNTYLETFYNPHLSAEQNETLFLSGIKHGIHGIKPVSAR